MNKQCAKCSKTVYPTEELKCLDKTWHKFCFKCEVCNMTLNMKNYKGFNKIPYCNAHYPSTKHTVVADTPENRRIAQNSRNQSQIVYHKEFEQLKGKKTSVVDDPETLRTKQVQNSISQIEYTQEKERRGYMEAARDGGYGPPQPQQGYRPEPSGGADYNPSPYSARTSAATAVYDSKAGGRVERQQQKVGSISDYNPMGEPPSPAYQPSSAGYQQHSYNEPQRTSYNEPQRTSYNEPPRTSYNEPQRTSYNEPQRSSYGQSYVADAAPPPPQQGPPPAPAQDPGSRYIALYDYTAADDDEVSFVEGDYVINGEPIDAGWMTGTIERTGQRGMLPSNYVETA